MFLAGVLRDYEDEVICDLAEYYGIYDIDSHPKTRVAILVKGLSIESRTMRKLTGIKYTHTDLMMGSILDNLNLLLWSKTKDGQKNVNRPSKITDMMLNKKNKQDEEVVKFSTGKEFENQRKKLLLKMRKGAINV